MTDMRILYSKLYIVTCIDLVIKYSIIDIDVIPYQFLCLLTFPKANASHLLNHSCGVRYHAVTSFV